MWNFLIQNLRENEDLLLSRLRSFLLLQFFFVTLNCLSFLLLTFLPLPFTSIAVEKSSYSAFSCWKSICRCKPYWNSGKEQTQSCALNINKILFPFTCKSRKFLLLLLVTSLCLILCSNWYTLHSKVFFSGIISSFLKQHSFAF